MSSEIPSKYREMAYLRSLGLTQQEISEKVGYSLTQTKKILRRPEIVELVKNEELTNSATNSTKSVQEVLDRAKLKAVLLLEQIVTDSDTLGDHHPSLRNRFDAAVEILGMVGISSKNIKVGHTHTHILQPSDMDLIRAKPTECEVIDVEPEGVKAIEHKDSE